VSRPPRAHAAELARDGTLLFGRYAVVRELGRGGYGTVYLARDPANHHELVALKIPSTEADDPRGHARFCREAGVLSTLRHPNVVAIRDFGIAGGHLFCAMEYVEGEQLWARVRRTGALPERDVRALAAGLLRALVALESAQVLHRDLKPANVILRRGAIAEPVLIDFGLARWHGDRGLTEENVFIGTIGYAAPEVLAGREPDNRSDLYSLGITLRYVLTGDDGPSPTSPLSPGFAALIRALTASEPARRPPSARVALAALEGL
jgi:serine/threonine-protein kinase